MTLTGLSLRSTRHIEIKSTSAMLSLQHILRRNHSYQHLRSHPIMTHHDLLTGSLHITVSLARPPVEGAVSLKSCPLSAFYCGGSARGGHPKKQAKTSRCLVLWRRVWQGQCFCRIFLRCGLGGYFSAFFAFKFVRFFLQRVGYGGALPKKGKSSGLAVVSDGWSVASVVLPQFGQSEFSGVIVRFWAFCPLFSAHRPAPKKSGQNPGRALPM